MLCVYELTQKATRIKAHGKLPADLTNQNAYTNENT